MVHRSTGKRVATARTKVRRRAQADGEQASLQELLAHPEIKRSRLPESQSVELATLVDAAPAGDEWLHEIKFDGYRMLGRVAKGKARFISRNGLDWTKKLPELAEAVAGLAVKDAMFDGEVVAVEPDGTTNFQSLQNAFEQKRTGELVYYLFDILHLNGHDVKSAPLAVRKEILRLVLSGSSPHDSIRL